MILGILGMGALYLLAAVGGGASLGEALAKGTGHPDKARGWAGIGALIGLVGLAAWFGISHHRNKQARQQAQPPVASVASPAGSSSSSAAAAGGATTASSAAATGATTPGSGAGTSAAMALGADAAGEASASGAPTPAPAFAVGDADVGDVSAFGSYASTLYAHAGHGGAEGHGQGLAQALAQ